MKRSILAGLGGFGCAMPLIGCVVAPPPPPTPRPVAVMPAPMPPPPAVVVAPAPRRVVVTGGYWHWYHGRRVWVPRRRYYVYH